MKEINKKYLREDQYKTTKYLEARIKIHQFTVNKFSFHEWIFDKLPLSAQTNNNIKILDVGCGTSTFWKQNIEKIKADIELVLTDFSEGMLEKARKNVNESKFNKLTFEVAEVEKLEKYKKSFDIVMCHNAVYHSEDKDIALQNLRDCLKDENSIVTITTNSEKHMLNVYEIGRNLDSNFPTDRIIDSFTEEVADVMLPKYFKIEKFVEEEILKVTDLEIMMNYVYSGTEPRGIKLKETFDSEYRKIVSNEISKNGFFKIIKRSPLYICKLK